MTSSSNELRLYQDVYRIICNFINDEGGPYEWGDFTTDTFDDPFLESVRVACIDAEELLYPYDPAKPYYKRTYRSEKGAEVLQKIAGSVKTRIDMMQE